MLESPLLQSRRLLMQISGISLPLSSVRVLEKSPKAGLMQSELVPAKFPDAETAKMNGFASLICSDGIERFFDVNDIDGAIAFGALSVEPKVALDIVHEVVEKALPDVSFSSDGKTFAFSLSFPFSVKNGEHLFQGRHIVVVSRRPPASLLSKRGALEAFIKSLQDSAFRKIAETQTLLDDAFSFLAARREEMIRPFISKLSTIFSKPFSEQRPASMIYEAAVDLYEKERMREAQIICEREVKPAFFHEHFSLARSLSRRIEFFAGPPNSGKTHEARKILCDSESGAYYAPLRLLALENRDAMTDMGVPTTLLTGEEKIEADGARHVSCTVEMAGYSELLDCVVIDEIQMLSDPDRGWAWTSALLGAPAKRVILVGSEAALPRIRALLSVTGEGLSVRRFERKTGPLYLNPRLVSIPDLKEGDAVVAFSRREVLSLKESIQRSKGKPCAVIYGALSPHARKAEAKRFSSGEAPFLVATDAIGMGLNLPIRRIVFSSLSKYDGVEERELSAMEFHQIAGRAGRFGFGDEKGEVSLLASQWNSVELLKDMMSQEPLVPFGPAWIAPSLSHLSAISSVIGEPLVSRCLAYFVGRMRVKDGPFLPAPLVEAIETAEMVEELAPSMNFETIHAYSLAPIDRRSDYQLSSLEGWIRSHAAGRIVHPPMSFGREQGKLEGDIKLANLWLWLSRRFPSVYQNRVACESDRDDMEKKLVSLLSAWEPRRKDISEKSKNRGGVKRNGKRRS